jgi:hypothetical protein
MRTKMPEEGVAVVRTISAPTDTTFHLRKDEIVRRGRHA